MALGITIYPGSGKSGIGGRRTRWVKFTGDAAIPAAGTGYTLTKALLQFPGAIQGGIVGQDTAGAYITTFDPVTGKFRWWNLASGTEAAVNEAGVNGKIVWGLFFGY